MKTAEEIWKELSLAQRVRRPPPPGLITWVPATTIWADNAVHLGVQVVCLEVGTRPEECWVAYRTCGDVEWRIGFVEDALLVAVALAGEWEEGGRWKLKAQEC